MVKRHDTPPSLHKKRAKDLRADGFKVRYHHFFRVIQLSEIARLLAVEENYVRELLGLPLSKKKSKEEKRAESIAKGQQAHTNDYKVHIPAASFTRAESMVVNLEDYDVSFDAEDVSFAAAPLTPTPHPMLSTVHSDFGSNNEASTELGTNTLDDAVSVGEDEQTGKKCLINRLGFLLFQKCAR